MEDFNIKVLVMDYYIKRILLCLKSAISDGKTFHHKM